MHTYQCKTDIISVEEKFKLLSQAMNCNYHNYETDKKTHTGLQVVSTGDGKLPLEGLVKELVNKVNPKLKFYLPLVFFITVSSSMLKDYIEINYTEKTIKKKL